MDVCNSTKVNVAVLAGTHDKEVNVPTYEWTEYFDKKYKFVDIKDLLEYHHFTMSSKEKGIVYCSKRLGDEPVKVSIIGKIPLESISNTNELPDIIPPKRIPAEKKRLSFH